MNRLKIFIVTMLLLGTAYSLFSGTNIEDHENFYTVHGLDEKTIRRSLTKNSACIENGIKFDAYTEWKLRWRYQWAGRNGKFHLTRFYTKLTTTITMPDWVDRNKADKALIRKWDKYFKALLKHELRHRQIGLTAARKLHQKFQNLGSFRSGKELSRAADKMAKQCLDEARRLEKDYDTQTNHGMNDGARFP